MNDTYKISFTSILILLFLLPLFFLPSTVLPLGIAKVTLIALGTIVIFLAFLYETLRYGRLVLPSAYLLWGSLALPLVYFLSALSSSNNSLSLFGYNLEIGTFGSILFMSALFLVTAIVFSNVNRIMDAYGVLVSSFSLVLIFAVVKVFSGGSFLTSIFPGVMGNPIGVWTDYAIGFGFLGTMCLFALEMLSLKKPLRIFFCVVLILSVCLMTIINFSIAWDVLFASSLVSLIYFLTVERRLAHIHSENSLTRRSKFVTPIVVLIVSLLFIWNPTISKTRGSLGNIVSSSFHVSNADVRPSLSSTLSIAASTMKTNLLFGSGPNTFDRDWLLYKPTSVNNTTFWNTAFPFGFGFLPTQVAVTGALGILSWLVFFVFYLILGVKALSKNSSVRNERFVVVSSFIGSLFLWIAVSVYVPSVAILALAFVFTGIFIGAIVSTGIISKREIIFNRSLPTSFASVLALILLGIGTLAFGFVSFQKISSVVYFEKALALSNTPGSSVEAVEAELGKASNLSTVDIYYTSLSQLEFKRAQAAVSATAGTPEENRQIFETAMSRSIAGVQSATKINPGSYANWTSLGALYAALVPKPIAIPGAYESAKSAFIEAEKYNPESPEIPLLLARVEFDQGNVEGARKAIADSISRKQDYADAYFLLTQLEISQNRIPEAIKSAETASLLSPENAGIFFEVGLLEYFNYDYKGSVIAFSKALAIVPDYANAKYYLGLSLDQLNRRAEAIVLFEDLAKSNPDNQGVTTILSNLKANHSAFYKTPTTNKPSSKTVPPITSKSKQTQ